MNKHIQDIIISCSSDKPFDVSKFFDSAIKPKITVALEQRKTEILSKVFNKK